LAESGQLHDVRARIYQVTDRFGLKDIQLAVEYGSTGEFPWCRLSRSRRNQSRDDRAGNEVATMGREFDRVITREGTGAWKQRNQRLIEFLLPIKYVTQLGYSRFWQR
jgi:hypothetical protein